MAKRHCVSEQSIYAWRKKFGDLSADDVKRLTQLEQGKNGLNTILAERDFGIKVMKKITAKNGTGRGKYRTSSVCDGSWREG